MGFNAFDFRVNGVKIKTPTLFTIEFQPISEGERNLAGRMLLEGVVAKHVVRLNYDFISKEELQVLLGQTWSAFRTNRSRIRQTITFPYFDDSPLTINTYFAPMSVSRSKSSSINGGWEDFTVEFIEL